MKHTKYSNLFLFLFVFVIIGYVILNSAVFYLEYKHNLKENVEFKIQTQKTQLQMMQNATLSIKNLYKSQKNTDKFIKNIQNNIPFLSRELWVVKIIETGNRLSLEVLFCNIDQSLHKQHLSSTQILGINNDELEEILKNDNFYKKTSHENKLKLQSWHKLEPNLIFGINETFIEKQYDTEEVSVFKETLNDMWDIFVASSLFMVASNIFLYFFVRWVRKKLAIYEEKIEYANLELAKRNKELEKNLYVDFITNLPNRISLDIAIEPMNMPRIMLFCIDDFRKLANHYGSDSGNFILREHSVLLQEFAKKNSLLLFKIDLDLFAFLEDCNLDIDRYEILAEELIKDFKGISFECPFSNLTIETSCTIAFCLEPADTLRKAMIALSEAKTKERDYIGYFQNIDSTREYADHLSWSNFIKDALQKDSVIPFYQPIFDVNGNITHYECLVRLLDSNQEAVSPGLFLTTSKRVKLYSQIIKSLIDKSFEQISKTDYIISINMSARDMTDSDVSNYVVKKIMQYDIANQIIFEILEDESIDKLDRIKSFINRVKRMGVKIAIDDFGTGYSNFVYMLDLKPDFLKIDGSLIKKIDIDTNAYAVVNAIVVFAKELGIEVTAEFIHSKEVYDTCIELGITQFQGFYLGEPRASF